MKKSDSSQDTETKKTSQEIVESRRKILDEQRQNLHADRNTEAYWMRCPKCGSTMKEEIMMDILLDRCTGCHGLFFDYGELETLIQAIDPGNFFSSLDRLLSKHSSH